MTNEFDRLVATAVKSQEQAAEVMEKLLAVAQPGMVYSEPINAEGRTVITASEVSVGMGFGFGSGIGPGTKPVEGETVSENEPRDRGDRAGGGGGGGGVSSGRPVAVISIGPEGVRVKPVIDSTKIALALFTTLGAMLIMLGKMGKVRQK